MKRLVSLRLLFRKTGLQTLQIKQTGKSQNTRGNKWKLVDEYGIGSFEETKEGLFFECKFANKDNMICWLLGFGDKVKLLEPPEIKAEYLKIIDRIRKKNQET